MLLLEKKQKLEIMLKFYHLAHIENSIHLKENVKIGPFSRVRPGS